MKLATCGNSNAAVRPCTTRKAINDKGDHASPQSAEANVKPPKDAAAAIQVAQATPGDQRHPICQGVTGEDKLRLSRSGPQAALQSGQPVGHDAPVKQRQEEGQ